MIISIKEEVMKSVTPGVGKITYGEVFRIKGHDHEIEIGNWLLNIFGGDIIHKGESKVPGIKTADIIWNRKDWEIKKPTTMNALDKRLQYGFIQIGKTWVSNLRCVH